jgi:xanthine/uracil permease
LEFQYGLDSRPKGTLFWLSALQWFVFMFASNITVPIVLGHAFGMTVQATALYTGRTLLICGVIAIMQIIFGHRYAILEGPSGLWWSVFLVLIGTTTEVGGSLDRLQQELEFGLIVSGALLAILAAIKVIDKVQHLFTPLVTGTYLILLSLQLSKSLVSGALGIGYMGSKGVNLKVAGLSLVLILVTITLSTKGKGLLKSLTILIGLLLGWVLFAIFGLVQFPIKLAPLVAVPRVFPFGAPHFQAGIVLTCIITVIVLLSNIIASIQAFGSVMEVPPSKAVYSKGTFASGVGTVLAGATGVVGNVPISGSASFVSLTGVASRLPFLVASFGMVLLGLFPELVQYAATLPAPVGYAVLFAVFVDLFGLGLKALKQGIHDEGDIVSCGLAILTGIGVQFISADKWSALPSTLVYLVNNGLIVGVVLVLLLQHVFFYKRAKG